jgi:hypothetical protein
MLALASGDDTNMKSLHWTRLAVLVLETGLLLKQVWVAVRPWIPMVQRFVAEER